MSDNCTGQPSIAVVTVTTSRVVPGSRRDDGPLVTGERVDEAAFADIRWAKYDDAPGIDEMQPQFLPSEQFVDRFRGGRSIRAAAISAITPRIALARCTVQLIEQDRSRTLRDGIGKCNLSRRLNAIWCASDSIHSCHVIAGILRSPAD